MERMVRTPTKVSALQTESPRHVAQALLPAGPTLLSAFRGAMLGSLCFFTLERRPIGAQALREILFENRRGARRIST